MIRPLRRVATASLRWGGEYGGGVLNRRIGMDTFPYSIRRQERDEQERGHCSGQRQRSLGAWQQPQVH